MPRMRLPRYYVTTPIYYVNDVPHIGHAYTTVAADTMARYKRLCGYETLFLTGTDEHGQKVEKAAAAAGENPQTLADRMVHRYQSLWQRLNISNTDFVRTTESRHQTAVTALFKKLEAKGDIYKGEYEGWYCVPCETFLTELQLVNLACPICGRPVEKIKEESYFFAMSKYQDQLLAWINKHPKLIQPNGRRNEIISFVSGGLKDLSISRTGFSWGIALPNDPKHIAYVWFDALVNYLTAVGYPNDVQRVRRFWPADLHLIGKDILRFHAVYWPAFLMAADLQPPRQIFSHGWWTVNGEKMSKSRGNVIDPFAMVDLYGADAFRYFLLREVPFGQDGDFSERALRQRYNSDLANDLGNLCFRTLSMIDRYAGGRIPPRSSSAKMKEDDPLHKALAGLGGKMGAAMGELAFHRALQAIWEVVETANRYIEVTAPWNLDKQVKKKQRLSTVLYNLAESLHLVSLYLYPFMPQTSERILTQIGIKPSFESWVLAKTARLGALRPGTTVKKTEPLFPRLEPTEEELAAEEAAKQRKTAGRGKQGQQGAQKEQKAQKQQQAPQPAGGQAPGQITIGDFSRMDFRTARILAAERIPNSQKLLKLRVSLGAEERQIVAGIGTKYEPDQLIGKQVVILANLRPAKLMGVESQGMVLAAGDAAVASLITPLEEVAEGMKVK